MYTFLVLFKQQNLDPAQQFKVHAKELVRILWSSIHLHC